MPILHSLDLPKPRNWQDFEDLCRDLWSRLWNDPDTQKHGSAGQPQAGVDIFGRPDRGKEWAGVQCKLKNSLAQNTLSPKEIEEEAEKARNFQPRLSSFIIATTGPQDARAQKAALKLTERGPFSVSVVSWSDIVLHLAEHPELVVKYFPQFRLDWGISRVQTYLLPPKLPPHYLQRSSYLEELKTALLAPTSGKVGIVGQGVHGLQGMGGIGKTVLAAAVAWDSEIQAAFPDGVLWLTFGQQPDLLRLLSDLAMTIERAEGAFTSMTLARGRLYNLLADRAVLLILDDVWSIDHAEEFDIIGPRGRHLITTRNAEVLVGLGATEHCLGVLSPDQALMFLADWAGKEVRDLPPTAASVARECGYLPLALAMIGAMVRLRPTAWEDALVRLKSADLKKIKRLFPNYPYSDLLRALEVSVEALEPWQRARYLDLAAFPEDTVIPENALEVLWSAEGLKAEDVRDLTTLFVARSLALRGEVGHLRLHDLQADYIRSQAVDITALHRRLVKAYQSRCQNGFASGPDDGYFFQLLPYHLNRGGVEDQLSELLLDFRWVQAKLIAVDLNSVLTDYDFLPGDREASLVKGALRLSADVLAEDKTQLASQLLGRLEGQEGKRLSPFLEAAIKQRSTTRLQPRFPALIQAGGSLQRTLVGTGDLTGIRDLVKVEEHSVASVNFNGDLNVWDIDTGELMAAFDGSQSPSPLLSIDRLNYRRVVTAADSTIQVWDIEAGEILAVLRGHTDVIFDVIGIGEDRVVSASGDHTLRIWNLKSCACLVTLEGHSDAVLAVAKIDERRVVSASLDDTLRVWDVETGETLLILKGHADSVNDVVRVNERQVVSASSDGTLRIWDVVAGETITVFKGHSDEVMCVAQLDNRRIVSGSQDKTLRVWNIKSGMVLSILRGHTDTVNGVARLDRHRIVSASEDHTLRIWNVQVRHLHDNPENHCDSIRAITELDARRVVSASDDCTLRVWDVDTGRALATLQGHTDAIRIVVRLDSHHIVSASRDKTLRVWDAEGGRLIWTLEGHRASVTGLVRLDECRVVSASVDKDLRVWNVLSGKMITTLQGHTDAVNAVARLSSTLVVSASYDHSLKVWDTECGRNLATLRGHNSSVNDVAFLGDHRIISISGDRTIRIWDVRAGKTLAILKGHELGIDALVLLNDRRAVSVSSDLRVWDLELGKILGVLKNDLISAVTRLDDHHFIFASSGRCIQVWDSVTGSRQAKFTLDNQVTAITAMRDGHTIIAGDTQGRIHFLDFKK